LKFPFTQTSLADAARKKGEFPLTIMTWLGWKNPWEQDAKNLFAIRESYPHFVRVEYPGDLAARRPLKSRASSWAGWMSGLLVRSGVSANMISVLSVVFSMGAGALLVCVGTGMLSHRWLAAAAFLIQSRLICNLMDGMVAIEGGRKSATGDLYNEVPDRIADVAILAGCGFCASMQPWGMHLGWLAASLAVMTAYIRMQGAVLTGKHDFRGPMAKPQRMALVTVTCVAAVVLPELLDWFFWALSLMVAGEMFTVWRRLSGISTILKGKP
jgi:phosphatidylglycerophosphate synthase